MSNLVLVTTEIEAPSVYLVQNRTVDEVVADFKHEAILAERRGWLYELKPSAQQHFNTSKLISLNFVRATTAASLADTYFRKALYYARINGHEKESEVLHRFTTTALQHLKDAKAKEAIHEGLPKGGTELLPTGK